MANPDILQQAPHRNSLDSHADCGCTEDWANDCAHRVAADNTAMKKRFWGCDWAEDIQPLLQFALEEIRIFQHDGIYSVLKLGIIFTFYVAADKQQARQYLSRLIEAVRDFVPSGTQLKNTSKVPMACMWIVQRSSLQPSASATPYSSLLLKLKPCTSMFHKSFPNI